jgi:hypothetical protein
MKQQVSRLTPHQNAKVLGILIALLSLVFSVPLFLVSLAAGPQENGPPAFIFLLLPVMYLFVGYLSVAGGCLLYNFLFKYIGGIEYEAKQRGT